MPSLLEAEPGTDTDPFADLIGGQNGAPAYQSVGGVFSEVPEAEINVPTDYGSFADLVPDPLTTGARTAGADDFGDFLDLVPASPTGEAEKALAETPELSDFQKLERNIGNIAPPLVGLHEVLNAVRVFGNAAGRYIFRGLEGATHTLGDTIAGDAPTVAEGAVADTPEHQVRLEELYHSDVADAFKQLPEELQKRMGIDPALAHTAPARIADAAGPAVIASAEALIPGIGLPLMVVHGAQAAEAEAKHAGQSDEEAEGAGTRAAIGLGIFGGASKVASAAVSSALPKLFNDPGKLAQFIGQFVGQEATNETTSRVLGAWEAASAAPPGQKIAAAVDALGDQTLEGGTFNAVYALMHAGKAVRQPQRATSPASEPVRSSAPETGVVSETQRYVEPMVSTERTVSRPTIVAKEQEPRIATESQSIGENRAEQRQPSPPSDIQSPSTLRNRLYSETAQPEPTRTEPNAAREIEPELNDWTRATAREEARIKHESEQEILAEARAHESAGGDELLDAVKNEGGLPALSSARAEFSGELQNVREELRSPSRKEKISYSTVFQKDAPDIDTLTHRLRAKGFNIETPGELLDLIRERIRSGREIFGNEARGAEAFGIVAPGTAELQKAGAAIGGAAKRLAAETRGLAEFHDFRKARLGWSARGQQSTGEITRASKELQKSVPDPTRRAAITNWIQAGGDKTLLAERAVESKNLKLRKGYEAARTLTPQEEALAGKVRQTFDILRKRAINHGIEINELDNYVNQIWRRSALKEFATTFSGRKLNTSIRFAKKRFHDSFFHGEQAGLVPETKDISRLLPIYMSEVNNAINSRMFVEQMAAGKARDGRPLLAPRGGGKVMEGKGEGEKGALLVFPDKIMGETGDYKALPDQPALHSWKWVAQENGKPVLVKGDLVIHPEAYSHLKNMLGQSAIREWYQSPSESALGDIGKGATKFFLDDLQQTAKATMLGFLSPFHQVQEGTHAIGHKVNPFGGLPKIDLSKPNQRDAAGHGLMLLPDRVSMAQFREGLDGSTRNLVANVLGKAGGPIGKRIKEWADGYQHYLFHEYIPALKLKTYEHILERNQKRFTKELASGKATLAQVKFLSAEQSNAAYGHLNYADMNRNPTLQHIAQVFLLAPDFLEARGRFAGQAAKGLVTKAGREQLAAIGTLAATQFVLARILNKTLDDDYHWDEPFAVVVGNRKYTMRSVPEDIYKAYQDWRKFTTGRLSPMVGRGLLEGLSGINYRNEPTGIGETFTNILAGMVPLTLQPATRGLTETTRDNPVSPFEQLLGSLGLHVSRFSPTSKVYHLAKEWQEANGLEQKKGLYPRSKYQQLRYALEDGDFDKARAAIDKLVADGEKKAGITEGFRSSILHPFTGNQANDLKFKKSLSAENKFIYEAAVKRRHELLRRYRAMQTAK